MTTIHLELPTVPARATVTVLATALETCGGLPHSRVIAARLLQHLVLVPAVRGLRSDRLALIAALQDHLPREAGHPVWLAAAMIDELQIDGWAALPRTQPLLWVA